MENRISTISNITELILNNVLQLNSYIPQRKALNSTIEQQNKIIPNQTRLTDMDKLKFIALVFNFHLYFKTTTRTSYQ